MTTYRCFTRTWWRTNKSVPGGLEPALGNKTTKRTGLTLQEALDFCREWNKEHKPGKLSRKCEYEAE